MPAGDPASRVLHGCHVPARSLRMSSRLSRTIESSFLSTASPSSPPNASGPPAAFCDLRGADVSGRGVLSTRPGSELRKAALRASPRARPGSSWSGVNGGGGHPVGDLAVCPAAGSRERRGDEGAGAGPAETGRGPGARAAASPPGPLLPRRLPFCKAARDGGRLRSREDGREAATRESGSAQCASAVVAQRGPGAHCVWR